MDPSQIVQGCGCLVLWVILLMIVVLAQIPMILVGYYGPMPIVVLVSVVVLLAFGIWYLHRRKKLKSADTES